ncbi:patatin-like phospholipase family protein [Bacillus cereus]|uniref:patatin-like phospholipase family protein n=1 Tax=Bacillus cereus TaxID=1396 RepID=UPI00192DC86A|nr:patatin-like phospholipase family protein [Bacillus cereus]MDA2330935.1 patatin-like phospholipase family protein [Bacillus cereus]MDA2336762.1 patatin-like phospholipase family protein [Bacillus cereus]
MKADAVFEGGGVRGIGHVGAVQVLEEQGYEWNNLAGTSAGSIVAALLASGYSGKELIDIMNDLDYKKILGDTWLDNIPVVGKGLEVCFQLGIHDNDYLEKWIENLLAKKNIHSFSDFAENNLKIIASDITNGRMIIFPDSLDYYGLPKEKMSVAKAVRMSSAIPFFFKPIKWETSKNTCYIVDGGLLSNYPVDIFDRSDGPPRWPTFGFRLSQEHTRNKPAEIDGPITFGKAIVRTMYQAHDLRHVDKHSEVRTIFIPTGTITSTKFSLSERDRKVLYESGYHAAQNFLETWDFEDYKTKYRGIPYK